MISLTFTVSSVQEYVIVNGKKAFLNLITFESEESWHAYVTRVLNRLWPLFKKVVLTVDDFWTAN